MHGFEHCRGAALGIDRTVDPSIAVIAREHHRVRPGAAANRADHVPNGSKLKILLQMQLHPYRSRPHVIVEWQAAFPVAGYGWAGEMLQDGRCIGRGNWSGGNFWH